ncbi:hypothetical protein K443DRAFT_633521 [Laccaria amethystina LaAM-08-1]|uniref:F-box domain-containing protein n=1 Tax=Laccaria amethystina LaAM-08-1 TaxID=1095629 RepID=A0A0C9WWC6_9AGAR|nr:hypothetical protein K443DRAFT_633521 [Laccaria amethystina LaAM-08-1]
MAECDHSENAKTTNGLLLQIAALESEIAKTQAVLLEQQEKHRRLRSQLNSLSPINQLPAEIKTEIFHKTLGLLADSKETEEGETPFFLGKICKSFRYFIWSTPILWTTIRLWLTKAQYEAQTDLLRDWLPRTANYPISFSLDTIEGPNSWIRRPPVEILTLLASFSAQWKEVRFIIPDTAYQCFDANPGVKKFLPLLTTASAYVTTEQRLDLSMAPQLSVLHLDKFVPGILVPWHQLRELSIYGCTMNQIRLIFFNAPQIIDCTFTDIDPEMSEDLLDIALFHQQVSVLEHLEYLELGFYAIHSEMSWMLEQVKFPSLREVSLTGPFGSLPEEAFLLQIVKPFRSSTLLEIFTFYNSKKPSDNRVLTQVLENIPSVIDLSLDFCKEYSGDEFFSEELLQRLYSPHADILLPNLQYFTYCGPTLLTEHMYLFRDVLVYRFRQHDLQLVEVDSEQRTVSQIQSVDVMSLSHFVISPDIQEELDTLRRDGLELSITHSRSSLESERG